MMMVKGWSTEPFFYAFFSISYCGPGWVTGCGANDLPGFIHGLCLCL